MVISYFPGDIVMLAAADGQRAERHGKDWIVIGSHGERVWISAPGLNEEAQPLVTWVLARDLRLVARSMRMTPERIGVLLHLECVVANDSSRRAIVRAMLQDVRGENHS